MRILIPVKELGLRPDQIKTLISILESLWLAEDNATVPDLDLMVEMTEIRMILQESLK